jgi:pyruvate formate lyase activating enzyme
MWQKRIETSLYAEWKKIKLLIDVIDEWIIDIKDLNPKIYLDYTGRDNDIVIQNLKKLIANVPKEKILIRVPYILGFNLVDDVERSVEELKDMGFSRIDRFEYAVL